MANITVDTQSAGYLSRLAQIQDIKAFYGSRIIEYLKAPPERQKIWRNNDPILFELLEIWYLIERKTGDELS